VENFELNKCYNESNLVTMAKMPDNFIDLTVTSPPYDNLRDYKGYSFPFEDIAKELYRVTKQGGVLVWVVSDQTINGSETGTSFKQALYFMECGFNLHDTMIYRRQARFPDDKRYQNAFEYMFVFSKGVPKTINLLQDKPNATKGTTRIGASERNIDGSMRESWLSKTKGKIKEFGIRDNIFEYGTGFMQSSKDEIAFEHPAIFPEMLAFDHIRSWSNENDLVYDCFMGSGTTAKAAISANRKWIGSEISEEYCKIIEKRLQPLLHNLFT
jgi:DNA modification methylase